MNSRQFVPPHFLIRIRFSRCILFARLRSTTPAERFAFRDRRMAARAGERTGIDLESRLVVGYRLVRLVQALAQYITDSVELALRRANGLMRLVVVDGDERIFSERFSCHDPRGCELPPDWSGGYVGPWAHQGHDKKAATM